MVVSRAILAAIGIVALLVSSPTAAPNFSDWSQPVNLGSVVNSTANDATPAVSKNGRSLYFSSTRKGPATGADLWFSQWDEVTGDWSTPVEVASVNSAVIDSSPALSRDEHWLFFHSNRGGNMDIWVSYRAHVHDDLGWESPVALGSGVNSSAEESMGGYFENTETGTPQILFSSTRPSGIAGLGGFNFYVSDLQSNGTLGPARLITELSGAFADPGMMVRFDGLEAFFYRTAGPGIPADIWTATRRTVLDRWSAPVNVTVLNSGSVDQRPYVAADRRTLYFASDRPDVSASGGLDLYVATRTMERP